jgi:hypothetical protein
LDLSSQKLIGDYAAKTLQGEVKRLRAWNWNSQGLNYEAIQRRECCLVVRRWNLPCLHLMLKRTQENCRPLLTLRDFPPHVIPPDFRELPAVPERTQEFEHVERRVTMDPEELRERLDPIISAVSAGDPHAQNCLMRSFEEYHGHGAADSVDTRLREPLRPRKHGRPNVHPSENSTLSFMPARLTKRCCSRCHQHGYNTRTCPPNSFPYVREAFQ